VNSRRFPARSHKLFLIANFIINAGEHRINVRLVFLLSADTVVDDLVTLVMTDTERPSPGYIHKAVCLRSLIAKFHYICIRPILVLMSMLEIVVCNLLTGHVASVLHLMNLYCCAARQNMTKAHISGVSFAFSQSLIFFAYAAIFTFGSWLIQHNYMEFEDMFK
jgi:hypothetical protein